MIKEKWYSYAAIRFTRQQVIFVLENIYTIREGIWPPNPKGSGYVDTTVVNRPQYTKGAGFEKPCEVGAEVWVRLQSCGFDGKLLESVHTWGYSHEALGKSYGLDEADVVVRVETALRYCSGWARKQVSYEAYRSHRRG